MKRVKFIYNPASGENLIANHLDEIIREYQSRGFTITPYRLDFKSPPEDMLDGLNRTYHHILIAGGDGTVNHVVNVLKKNSINIPVAVLPAGTANDFAAVLGVPTDVLKGVKAILDGKIVPVDLGIVNGEYFVNVFSCGLFTDISQKTPTIMKNTFGKLAYYVGGIGELTRFRKMQVRIKSDGGNYEGPSVIFFVFNGRTAGSLNIAYKSEINDGLLDVLIFKGDNPLETMQTVMHYMPLIGSHKDYPAGIVHLKCSTLQAFCETSEHTDMDGQPGPGFPLEIECEKGGLRILCPVPEKNLRKRRKAAKRAENRKKTENKSGLS